MEFSARPRPSRLRRLGLLLAVAAVATAGCGSAAASRAAATTTTPPGARRSLAAFTHCLSTHGVPASDLPKGPRGSGGQPSGSGAPAASSPTVAPSTAAPPASPGVRGGLGLRGLTATYRSAFTACRSLLPAGGSGRVGSGVGSARFAAYRNCLKLHGVSLPSRPRNGGTGTTPGRSGTTPSSAAFQAARKACANLLPRGSTPAPSTSVPRGAAA